MRVGSRNAPSLVVPDPPARGGGRRVHNQHAEAERRVLLADHDPAAAARRHDRHHAQAERRFGYGAGSRVVLLAGAAEEGGDPRLHQEEPDALHEHRIHEPV